MDIQLGQILSQMVAFLIMLWVLKRYAWKPMLSLLDERRKKIQDAFQLIDEQNKQVNDLKEEYKQKLREIRETAQGKYQDEVLKGQNAALEIENSARQKGKEIVSKAQREAENEIQMAKAQLKSELVDLIMASTQKVIQTELQDGQKQKIQIEEFLGKAEVR